MSTCRLPANCAVTGVEVRMAPAGDAKASRGRAVDRLDRRRNWLAHACSGLVHACSGLIHASSGLGRHGLTALGFAALLCGSAYAHHSLTAEFDTRKVLVLTGVVSRVQWANPHIYVDLDVTDKA